MKNKIRKQLANERIEYLSCDKSQLTQKNESALQRTNLLGNDKKTATGNKTEKRFLFPDLDYLNHKKTINENANKK